MNRIWYFEQVNLFKIICPTKFGNYSRDHSIKQYDKGGFVYFTDDPSTNVFLISNGKVKILNYSEDGDEVVKGILTKGDLFGEMAVLGEEKRSDFAMAIEKKTSVCQINTDLLRELMLEDKEFSLTINKLIGLKIRKLERRLDSMVFKDVRSRIIDFIKDLANESGKPLTDRISIEHFYTHKDIADLVGASRQTVTTIFNELKSENLIFFKRKLIEIPDLSRLK